jgi:hypothetical protein
MNRILILFFLLLAGTYQLAAQCAMCKAGAEQSLENGAQEANWLNFGILFLMTIPYIIMLILFLRWKKNKNKTTHSIQ